MLLAEHCIPSNRMLALVNLPVGHFGSALPSKGESLVCLDRLRAENMAAVIRWDLISIDWQGWLYECDFNQMLGLPLGAGAGRAHLRDLPGAILDGAPIAVDNHCHGCTADQGSSYGGALPGAM